MEDQRIDLLDPVLAQRHIGPGDAGVVPNLRLGGVLAPEEHPRHDIFGYVRFHLARVEVLHHHQYH